jgi:hypothetical protein
MSLSSQDKELLKRLALAESGGEGVVGMALVIRSVLNRREAIKNGANFGTGGNSTIRSIVYAPNQYTPVRNNSINQSFSSSKLSEAERAYQLAQNPLKLQETIEKDRISPTIARNLVLSTGFDALGGQGRSATGTYRAHTFVQNINDFGVTGDSIYRQNVTPFTPPVTPQTPQTSPTYVEGGTSPNGQTLYIITQPDGTQYSTNNLPSNAVRLEDSTTTSPGRTESIGYDIDYSEFTLEQLQDQAKFLDDQFTQLEREYQQREADNLDLTSEEVEQLDKIRAFREALIVELRTRLSQECPPTSETNTSWSGDGKKCDGSFNRSALAALEAEIEKQYLDLPDPCGKGTLAGINNALSNFFDFLKGIKKYYNLYVQGTINQIQNLTSIISRTADIIASILKLLIQRVRNYILNLLRQLIEKVIDRILTSLTKNLKNAVIKAINDALICKFNEIIKGLTNLVVDFLYAMIGNVINAPICAVEQFTNALLNNLAVQVDRALAPILDGINDILGGVARIAGNVFQAIDFILGFESFLCAKPKCPQIKSWRASAGSGPTPEMEESFNNFQPIPNADRLEEGILNSVDSFIGGVLPGVSIFGDERIEGSDLASGTPPPGVQCFPGAFRCGPPNVVFFGGGGIGAVGNAVVNSIGEVVGVDLTYGGAGYTSPPFVVFEDNCENGSYASGYTIINNEGQVIDVVMVNSGVGYLNNVSGTTEFSSIPEELIPPVETTTREYVTCLDRIEIVNTGIGYLPTDSVSITPDLPGLQVKIQITEVGQIVSMDVLNSGCGFAEIPEITINSDNGSGLEVRPVMRFVRRKQYLQEQPDFVPSRLIQVVDCVLK